MMDYSKELLKDSILKFIIRLNTLYNSHVFTSSSITKEIIKTYQYKKTFFSKIHKITKEVLDDWTHEGICIYLYNSKLGRSRRTKAIYQFTPLGMVKIRRKIISRTTEEILLKKENKFNYFIPRRQITKKIHQQYSSF